MEIIQMIIGSGGLIGVLILIFRTGKIVQKIESMDEKIGTISSDIKDMKKDITDLKVQIGKLETRVEERTLKVVHVQGNGTDGKSV